MTPLTTDQLRELRELDAKASPAPWCIDDHVVTPGDTPNELHIYEAGEDDPPLFSTGCAQEADVRLVIALRNAVPQLAAALETQAALQQENEKLAREVGLTAEDLAKASNGYETLGPGYFAARRIAETLMAGTEAEPLLAVVKKVVDQIQTEVYEYVETHMRGDLEHNLQGHLTRMLDDTVRALLTGQQWALDRYPLAKYHDGEAIRKEIAKHCGETAMTMRVAELEKECARLRESLEIERRYR